MFPKTFYPSKMRSVIMLAGSLAFVAIGLLVQRDDSRTMWFPIGFFGLCSAVFAVSLVPQAGFLRLDDESFTFASLFRQSTVKWRDVAAFYPGKVMSNPMVFFDYALPGAPHPRARRVSVELCGHEAALPNTYGMTAEQLAALMNEAKHHAENA